MKYSVAAALAFASVVGGSAQAEPPTSYDLIIRNGTVMDGTGRPAYKADIAITGRAIVKIGSLSAAHVERVIDANGRIVSPGFINVHSHAAAEGMATAENMLTQGVTTEFINPDGFGPVDIEAQLAEYSAKGLAENLGAMIGFNAIWTEVVASMIESQLRSKSSECATWCG